MNSILLFLELIFAKKSFYKINKFLYYLSLKGLGVENRYDLVEKTEHKIIGALLKNINNPIIIDVGGNVGNYAKSVMQYHPNCKLFSFEPHPKTYLKLKDAANQFGFTAINKGCADMEGTLQFYDYANNDGSEHASLLKNVFEDIYQHQTVEYKVDVTTLDTFIEQSKIEYIDLLKIDTEGFEFNVLKGCEKTITQNKIKQIQFEFNSMNTVSKVFMKDFIKLLPQYSFYRVLPDGLLKIETDKILLTEIFGFQNIVAINNHLN